MGDHLAYDSATGHLVYDPTSGHLARTCGGIVAGSPCRDCTGITPLRFRMVVSGMTPCPGCWVESGGGVSGKIVQLPTPGLNGVFTLTQMIYNGYCDWRYRLAFTTPLIFNIYYNGTCSGTPASVETINWIDYALDTSDWPPPDVLWGVSLQTSRGYGLWFTDSPPLTDCLKSGSSVNQSFLCNARYRPFIGGVATWAAI